MSIDSKQEKQYKDEFSSSDILRSVIENPKLLKHIDKIVDLASGLALRDVSNPEGTAVEPNANTNTRVPLCAGQLLAYEKRLNELLGICETIGRPLYPRMTYFSDLIHNYLRLTPSVQGKRAEKVLEVLGGGGAIARMPDTGYHMELGSDATLEPAEIREEE